MKRTLRKLLPFGTALLVVLLVRADAPSQTPISLQNFNFDSSSGVSNRLITPNNDGFNDSVVFTFLNPRDSAVSGVVFDLSGAEVAKMEAGPVLAFPSATLRWSPSSDIAGGVYIYQIRAEDFVHTGTLVVVK